MRSVFYVEEDFVADLLRQYFVGNGNVTNFVKRTTNGHFAEQIAKDAIDLFLEERGDRRAGLVAGIDVAMPAGKGDGGAELPDPRFGRRPGSIERTAVQDAGDHREDEQRNRDDERHQAFTGHAVGKVWGVRGRANIVPA